MCLRESKLLVDGCSCALLSVGPASAARPANAGLPPGPPSPPLCDIIQRSEDCVACGCACCEGCLDAAGALPSACQAGRDASLLLLVLFLTLRLRTASGLVPPMIACKVPLRRLGSLADCCKRMAAWSCWPGERLLTRRALRVEGATEPAAPWAEVGAAARSIRRECLIGEVCVAAVAVAVAGSRKGPCSSETGESPTGALSA